MRDQDLPSPLPKAASGGLPLLPLILALLTPGAPVQAQFGGDGARLIELARLYQRVEEAYARHAPLEPEQRRRAGAEMDAVTRAFFMGGRGVRTHLDAALLIITGEEDHDVARALLSLDAEVLLNPSEQTCVVEVRRPAEFAETLPASSLTIELRSDVNDEARPFPLREGDGEALRTQTMPLTDLPEGRWKVNVITACGRRMTAGVHMHLHAPLAGARDEIIRRADAVLAAHTDDPIIAARYAILVERARVLTDPPARDVTQWTLDLALLRDRLRGDIETLEAGEDPYASLAGDHWLRIPAGINPLPARVIVPPFDETTPRRPLVIALHGAGGNEHLFPDGHGAGALRTRALSENFVVVSPATQMMARGPTLPELIDFLHDRAHIDPQRVSIIGHSMGGMTAVLLAGQFPQRLHRVVAIAGARPVPESARTVPMWIIGAERDQIVQESMVRRAAETSIEQGANVTYDVEPDADHLLVVADVLTRALDFVLTDADKP